MRTYIGRVLKIANDADRFLFNLLINTRYAIY